MFICKVSYEPEYRKRVCFGNFMCTKNFYSVHFSGAGRTIQVYSTIQPSWAKKNNIEECKIKFSFLKVGHILYRYISMYFYQD